LQNMLVGFRTVFQNSSNSYFQNSDNPPLLVCLQLGGCCDGVVFVSVGVKYEFSIVQYRVWVLIFLVR
jgi:cation transport regulator ChaC